MSKLFKLKEWLSISDAATHLGLVFDEKVTEADILSFALNGSLTISVNLVNGENVRFGKLIPIADADFEEIPDLSGGESIRCYRGPTFFNSDQGETHVLSFEQNVVNVRGVFDLPMLGGEQHDVEHRFHSLTGGPPIKTQSVDGAFVKIPNGPIGQLLEDLESNKHKAGSMASLVELKNQITAGRFTAEQAEELLSKHEKDRIDFLARRQSEPHHERFYPAGGLPDDCALVVRTRALTDFIALANEDEKQASRPQSTRERDSLLKLILGMALECYRFDPKASKSPTTKEIAEDLAKHGISMNDDTVRKYLKEAVRTFLPAQK